MKDFKKDSNGSFICEECGKTYELLSSLMCHVGHSHNGKNDYYNKWIIEEKDGKCKICGKPTILHGSIFLKFCSHSCSSIYNRKLYGTPFSDPATHNKTKQTNFERYGVVHNMQRKEVRETCKKTFLSKYGVESPSQNKEIFEKGLKTRRLIKKFRDTSLTYQGSYELDFLEKFYDKIDIEKGSSISYIFEDKNKVYHSDFYIPSKNLIVEIKSSYILTLDESIYEKKESCLKHGYNYILILNKNYEELNKILNLEYVTL